MFRKDHVPECAGLHSCYAGEARRKLQLPQLQPLSARYNLIKKTKKKASLALTLVRCLYALTRARATHLRSRDGVRHVFSTGTGPGVSRQLPERSCSCDASSKKSLERGKATGVGLNNNRGGRGGGRGESTADVAIVRAGGAAGGSVKAKARAVTFGTTAQNPPLFPKKKVVQHGEGKRRVLTRWQIRDG